MFTKILLKTKASILNTLILFFLFLISVVSGILLFTDKNIPHDAELAFVELSNNDGVIGSIVPASCESTPPDWNQPGPCVCTISASACSGPLCTKRITVNTNYGGVFMWGGLIIRSLASGDTTITTQNWSGDFNIPLEGDRFSVLRTDGVMLCTSFVAGPPAPIITLTATPSTIDPGNSSNINWTVFDATSCTASDAWSGTKSATGGTETVSPTAVTNNYALTCSGPGGTTTRAVAVTVNPPQVSLEATPSLIGPGSSSDLVWTVSGANSCTASDGWSGTKSATGGTQAVSPSATTQYTLTCSGPSGTTTDTAVLRLPSGSISASSCVVPVDGVSCNSTVQWTSANFLGARSVRQTSQFSTAASSPGTSRSVSPVDDTFTLRDVGSTFVVTTRAGATCATGSVWAASRCTLLPVITIEAEPDIVRSGSASTVEIEVLANYPLECTVQGAVQTTFTHTGSASATSYTFNTSSVTSAQDTKVTCTNPTYPALTGDDDVRVEVIPVIQEI